MKIVLAVLVTVLMSACAAPDEKRTTAPTTLFVEQPEDALGDWNTRDPIERLLQPTTSDFT